MVSIPRKKVASNSKTEKAKKKRRPRPSPDTLTNIGNTVSPRIAPILLKDVPNPCPVALMDVGKISCGYTKSVPPGPSVCVTSKITNMTRTSTAAYPTEKADFGSTKATMESISKLKDIPAKPIMVIIFLPSRSIKAMHRKLPRTANREKMADPSMALDVLSPKITRIVGLNNPIP